MFRTIHALILVAGLVGLVAQGLAQDSPPARADKGGELGPKGADKKDLELIEGAWITGSKYKFEGEEVQGDEAGRVTWTFKGGIGTDLRQGKVIGEYTYKLYPDKNPKEIDIVITFCDRDADFLLEGDKAKGKMVKGIYAFEGKTLKVALGRLGGERPTNFSSEGRGNRVLYLEHPK